MVGGNLCQSGRGCNHKGQCDERPGVKIEYGAHVGISLPKLVCQIMRVGVFRETRHDAGEDEDMAEDGIVGRHCLPALLGSLPESTDISSPLTNPCLLNLMALILSL